MSDETTPVTAAPSNGAEEPMQAAAEQVTNIAEARKPSKQELARQKIYMERRQRHINKGVPPEMVDQVMAREDYERLPTDEKIKRLENNIGNALRQLSSEIANLRHNDGVIADAMDMNFRALGKILNKLGVEPEEQRSFLKEASEEMRKEQEEKHRAAVEQQAAAQEKAVAEQALAKEDHQGETPAAPEAPPEATNFGG